MTGPMLSFRRMLLASLLTLFALFGCKAAAAEKLPADLDLVPRDAAGFVHIRAADIWKSEWLADIRLLIDKAGPEAWKAFERKCVPHPATIDRVTLVMLTPQTLGNPFPTVDPEAVSALVIVSTSKPYDRLQVMKALGHREKAYRRNLYYFNEDLWSGLLLIDDRTFIIGSEDALVQFLELRNKKTGPLQSALEEAAGKNQAVVGLNMSLLGKHQDFQGAPPPLQPLFKAECGILAVNLDKEFRFDLRLNFPKEDDAKAGEKAFRDGLEMARQGLAMPLQQLEKQLTKDPDDVDIANLPQNFASLLGLGALREIDGLLKNAVIERQNTVVKLPLKYKRLESFNPLMASWVSVFVIGRAASTTFSQVGMAIGGGFAPGGKDPLQEHMEKLAKAMEQYHKDKGHYPPAALHDKEGRPVLSWRVALLPYLGEEALYKEFRLDEPWDSLHNKKLIKRMPQALRDQSAWRSRWKTQDLVFTGEGTVFEAKKQVRKADVAAATILLVHAGEDSAVYWTKPADLSYAADKPVPNLFGKYGQSCQAVAIDGSVRTLTKDTDEQALRSLIRRQPKDK